MVLNSSSSISVKPASAVSTSGSVQRTPCFGQSPEDQIEIKKDKKETKSFQPLNPWKEGAKIGLKNAFRVGGLVSDGIYMALLTGLSIFTGGLSLAGLPFVIVLGPVYRFLTGLYQGYKGVKTLNEDIVDQGTALGMSQAEMKSEAEALLKSMLETGSGKKKKKAVEAKD